MNNKPQPIVIQESTSHHSTFLLYKRPRDKLALEHMSLSAEEGSGESKPNAHALTYLRLEFRRIRPGMSDYLIRVSTPVIDDQKNTVLTLRGNRALGNADGAEGTAMVIGREMANLKDTTFSWDKLDVPRLGNMILPTLKFFSTNIGVEVLQVTTEAL